MAAQKKGNKAKQDNEELWQFSGETEAAPVVEATSSTTSTSAPASTTDTSDALSWGSVYKTVGDVPKESVSYALPKADYRNACYMWQVPNYEVVVPGAPYYRMPINHSMLSAFGFLDTDTLEEVIVVSDCSDWDTYAKGRASGKWLEMQEKILQQAVPIAPAPSPAATAPTWDWSKVTELNLQIIPRKKDGSLAIPATDNNFREGWKTYMHALVPSLDLSGMEERQPIQYVLTTPACIQSAVSIFFSGADAETIKEECQQAAASGSWLSDNGTSLVQTIVPADQLGSYTFEGTVLDASTIKLEVSIVNCVSTN